MITTPTHHETYVHHIAIDLTGTYLATCSSDRRVQVFSRDGNQWTLRATLRDHFGTVHKVAWSHPDLGLYLASCGVDRRVNIYRIGLATPGGKEDSTPSVNQCHGALHTMLISQVEGIENADTICDVAFCPPKQSNNDLLIAVASLDGSVRFYLVVGVKLSPTYSKISPCADERDAVGASPMESNSLSTAPTARRSVAMQQRPEWRCSVGVSAIAWATSITEVVPTIALGTVSGLFDIYSLSRQERKFLRCSMELSLPSGGRGGTIAQLRLDSAVTCIAWAPSVGRRHQLVAVCSRTSTVILKLTKLHSPDSTQCSWSGEVFSTPTPAASASWDSTASVLTLASDVSPASGSGGFLCALQLWNVMDHQSWVEAQL